MKATYHKYILDFKQASGTSRGVLTQKETWFIIIQKDEKYGVGECGILRGLSHDDVPEYEKKLQWTCANIHLGKDALWENLMDFPSIQFGIEMAFLSFESEHPFVLFPSEFTNGNQSILINGLIWMGSPAFMKEQIQSKINEGFQCLKLKIGAIDFDKELEIISLIRADFTLNEIEIRVDANGGFSYKDALDKLIQLNDLQIHSIEQPIRKMQTDSMAALCKSSPIPIALDEELIGVVQYEDKLNLLQKIKPQYIILKPSFVGGFRGTQEWIAIAESLHIGWWITSALESNVGLNAIAQFTFLQNNLLPQGLGTGALYTNNFDCPLEVKNGNLIYNNQLEWKFDIQQLLTN